MRIVALVKSVKIDDEPSVTVEFEGGGGGRGAMGTLWTKDAELRDWWETVLPGQRVRIEIVKDDS